MGCDQAVQPMLPKEGVSPPLVIGTAPATSAAAAAAEHAAQSHPDPFIQTLEREATAVLEISKPANQGPIQLLDDDGQALP